MAESAGIVQFITAQLGADEALAVRNSDGHGLADGFPDYRTYTDADTDAADEYIRVFGPARVLAEIAAKRRILALHMGSYAETGDGTRHYFCQDRAADPDFNGDLWAPCLTARLLAAPFAGREGWLDEWALAAP